ncbi:MAG: hypothetical protein HPY53_09865 [Brevinematales bacterium]|nr:hypothetical protein [Brevinematales bacterium]
MRNIIDSIIKVEHEVQQNSMETEKKAKAVLDEARAKAIKMEEEYQNNFEKEMQKRKDEITLEVEKRQKELDEMVGREKEKKQRIIEKKRQEIKEKLISMILEK